VAPNFFNFYNHDFVRVAIGVPSIRVADPAFNSEYSLIYQALIDVPRIRLGIEQIVQSIVTPI